MTPDTLSPLTKFLRIGGRRPGSLQAVSRQLCPTSAEPRRGKHECAIAGAMIATRCTYGLSRLVGPTPGGPACVPLVISRRARCHDHPPEWRASPERLPSSHAHPPEPPGGRAALSGNMAASESGFAGSSESPRFCPRPPQSTWSCAKGQVLATHFGQQPGQVGGGAE